MVWHHKGFPPPKKLKTWLLASKIMASVFWDLGMINMLLELASCQGDG
jgi:hypothetical protein